MYLGLNVRQWRIILFILFRFYYQIELEARKHRSCHLVRPQRLIKH